jgi:hypothetical protein
VQRLDCLTSGLPERMALVLMRMGSSTGGRRKAFRERLKGAGKACWWANGGGAYRMASTRCRLYKAMSRGMEMYQDAIKEMEKDVADVRSGIVFVESNFLDLPKGCN